MSPFPPCRAPDTIERAQDLKHRSDMKVCVAFPRRGDPSYQFMASMLGLWRWDGVGARLPDGKKVGGRRHLLESTGFISRVTAILVRARTDIVNDFLATTDDYLFMVDDDMTFNPDVVDRFLEAAHPTERPIVGGLAFGYMGDMEEKFWPTLYAWKPGTQEFQRLTQYADNAMMQVGATGAACLFVHRSVFEAMRDKFGGQRPWFAETEFVNSQGVQDMLSEDLTFCLRAQSCGFPIFVHTGIKFGHVKSFTADEAAFVAECERLSAPVRPELPTFAVIASKDRPEMLTRLVASLEAQGVKALVYNNGYIDCPVYAEWAHGVPLHTMWNFGLYLAEQEVNAPRFNVLIVNDDVELAPDAVARLEAGLRARDDIGIAYPAVDLERGQIAEATNPEYAGQTLTGWCFMLRGEDHQRFDEQFEWWYGDSDMEKQVRAAGQHVVGVGGVRVNHLDPMSSSTDPERLEQARSDEKRFAAKWGMDPAKLWLATHPEFGRSDAGIAAGR